MSIQSETDYKPDFEILDRYLTFSSELLRISLLAIGGFGSIVLIKLKDEKDHAPLHHFQFLFISICFFALCAALSLFHRFYASDSMSWYVSYLRAKASGNEEKANRERKEMHKALRYANRFLIFTEYIFGIAVLLFAAGICKLLF